MALRPRVIVYVTREHPDTGADQLLVFEESGDLHVPAGGIEPGETVAEAAAREVREETGLEGIRVTRDLGGVEQPGRLEPGFLHQSHFLQAAPTVTSPDEWEHEGVRCRWAAISADMPLWPPHAVFVKKLIRERVVAFVTRERAGRTELLTIEHRDIPEAGVQVPAGRIDPEESFEDGLRREVEEETGVSGVRLVGQVADAEEFAHLFGVGAHKTYVFHAAAQGAEGPDEWEHPVTGTGMDAGLVYVCRWVPLEECPPLWGKPDPLVDKLRRSITTT